jgi:hypothetical protein
MTNEVYFKTIYTILAGVGENVKGGMISREGIVHYLRTRAELRM